MGEEADFTLKLIDQMTAPSKQITDQLQNMNNTLFASLEAIKALHKVQKDPAPKTFADKFRDGVTVFHDMFEIARDVGGEIFKLGKEFVNAGAEEEAFVRRLELLTGSKHVAEDIAKAMDSIRPAFKGTETEMKALVAQTLKLGFGADELKNILPLAFDVKAIGGTQAGAEKFLEIMNKAAMGVKLSAKDTKFFRDELGLVVKEGITGAAAMKQMGDAITAKKGGLAGAASVQAAQSLDNLLVRLGELPRSMFSAFAATPGFEKLRKTISDLLDKVGPGTPMFAKLAATVSDLATRGIAALTLAAGLLSDNFGHIVDTVDVLFPVLDVVATAMGALFGAINVLLPVIIPLGIVIGALAAKQWLLNAALSANPIGAAVVAVLALTAAFKALYDNWALIKDIKFSDVFGGKTAADYGAPITAALKNVPAMAKVTGEDTGTAVKTGFASTTESHSPSKVFERFGKGITAGLDKGVGEPTVPMPNMTEAAAAPAGGNSTKIGGVTLNVNVEGSSGDPSVLAAKLAELLPGALASAFEDLALQQGAA